MVLCALQDLCQCRKDVPKSPQKVLALKAPPPIFLRDAFVGLFFLRENVNLMYFARDVVIESLVVIRYSLFLYVKP